MVGFKSIFYLHAITAWLKIKPLPTILPSHKQKNIIDGGCSSEEMLKTTDSALQ